MQVQLAQQAMQEQIKARQQGISAAQAVATMSPAEIASINQMLTTQGIALNQSLTSISKQQTLLNDMDPQVKAAGKNLYGLLTGQSAAILKPLQTQLDYRRNQLVSQLSSQMGPGFMTSSAGIQALTQFDNEAALTLNSAQLQALQTVGAQYGSLAGMEMGAQSEVTGKTLMAYQQTQVANAAAAQMYEAGTTRKTNATLGAMSANPINAGMVPSAQGSVVQTAGNPFAGQAVGGQGLAQAAGAVGAGVGQIAGYGMFKDLINGGGGGGGAPLSSQIGNYEIPNLSPGFGSMIAGAGGGYSGNLGANVSF